jgi:hypothetical protein
MKMRERFQAMPRNYLVCRVSASAAFIGRICRVVEVAIAPVLILALLSTGALAQLHDLDGHKPETSKTTSVTGDGPWS